MAVPAAERGEGAGAADSKRVLLLALAGFAAIAVAGLPSLWYPPNRDQSLFACIGDQWNHGLLPYRDSWDIKPPGIYAIYAVAFRVFGRSFTSPRVADLLSALMAATALWAIVCLRRYPLRAFATVAVFGAAYFACHYWMMAQAESFASPLASLLVYCVLRAGRDARGGRWLAVGGLLLGCLILLKTPFALVGLLGLTRPKHRGDRAPMYRMAVLGSAAVLPIALTVAYFAAHQAAGYLLEMLRGQYAYSRGSIPATVKAIGTDWAQLAEQPALWLCVAAAGVSLLRPDTHRSPDTRLARAWLAIAAVIFGVQQHFPYQAVIFLPPVALLAGGPIAEALARAVRELRERRRMRTLPWVVVVAAAVLVPLCVRYVVLARHLDSRYSPAHYWATFRDTYGYSYADTVAAAEYVRAHTRPGDPLLVYAFEPAVYFLADRRSPTRHLYNFLIFENTQIPLELRRRWLEEVRRDVAARPPAYLITTGDPHELGMVGDEAHVGARVVEPTRVVLGGHPFALAAWVGRFTIYRLDQAQAAGQRASAHSRGRAVGAPPRE
jgi:hypothetical protein